MLKRLIVVLAVVALVAVAPAAQAAPMLYGGFSLASVPVGPGLSPLLPIGPTGAVLTSFTGATAFDFTATGLATPGVPGVFAVNSTSGVFDALFASTGAISDFTFQGAAQTNYPVPPIMAFESITSPVLFTFDLTAVTVQDMNSNLIDLVGKGVFHMAGYADTPGLFFFTANSAASTFSFSASEAVPEPGTLVLMGSGLIGLAAAVRRRLRK